MKFACNCLAGLCLLMWFPASYAQTTQPNILLIYVDDLGYGDLGSYGHPVIKTPNLDALADDALRLTSYYAPSALCSPSRASLLTGRYSYRTGVRSWIPHGSGVYLRNEEVTLAETLKDVGYQTAHIGKWHLNSDLGNPDEAQPTDQGFDYFYGHNAFQIPTNRNPTNIFRNGKKLKTQIGYTADLYADEAISWLEKRKTDNPFFLYLSMAEPHVVFENPPDYNAMYAQYTTGEIVPVPNDLPGSKRKKMQARGPGEYYANITYMDAQLGRVLDWLSENNLKDETVIVFASDNGPVTSDWHKWFEANAYGSTGGYRGRKHLLYEGGIRVPAIIRYPGVTRAGMVSDETITGSDLFVTLTNIGGGKIPDDRPIDGIDIQTALSGDKLEERGIIWALSSVSDLEFAVRRGPWKLLLNKKREARELFNLSDDPLEFYNLMTEKPEVTKNLMKVFDELMHSIDNDPFKPETNMDFRFAQ